MRLLRHSRATELTQRGIRVLIVRWVALPEDVMQRCLSSRLELSFHEFRLAVKLSFVSDYVFDSKHERQYT